MQALVFATDFGWVGILGSEMGLRQLMLPQPTPQAALKALSSWLADDAEGKGSFGDLPQRIRAYFRGEPVLFPDALDMTGLSPFRRAVYEVARAIPRGETRSYGWVAAAAGSPGAARAVGQAMAHNPWAIIVPCHRIVRTDGGLGGFGGGLELKERMLGVEGAEVPHRSRP